MVSGGICGEISPWILPAGVNQPDSAPIRRRLTLFSFCQVFWHKNMTRLVNISGGDFRPAGLPASIRGQRRSGAGSPTGTGPAYPGPIAGRRRATGSRSASGDGQPVGQPRVDPGRLAVRHNLPISPLICPASGVDTTAAGSRLPASARARSVRSGAQPGSLPGAPIAWLPGCRVPSAWCARSPDCFSKEFTCNLWRRTARIGATVTLQCAEKRQRQRP